MPLTTEEYFGSLGETVKGIKELQDWIDGTGEHQDRTQGQKKAARTIMEEHEKEIQKMLEEEDIKVTKKEAKEELVKELKKEKKTSQMLRVLKRITQPITIKQFVSITGMKESTARRELGQAVLPGSKKFTKDIVRVGKKGSKGVKYRFK